MDDAVQRRQKRRHDPRNQREVPPPNPSRELRPRQCAGKEPAGSSPRKEPRKAPYIMQGQPMHPPSRANPTRRGIAHDICPSTPPRLQVEYSSEQCTYPHIPWSRDPELFMDSRLRWEETIISRMRLLGRLARKKYTNMRSVKDLRGIFGASFMKTFIPQL